LNYVCRLEDNIKMGLKNSARGRGLDSYGSHYGPLAEAYGNNNEMLGSLKREEFFACLSNY
jgi:hypothetical protein